MFIHDEEEKQQEKEGGVPPEVTAVGTASRCSGFHGCLTGTFSHTC